MGGLEHSLGIATKSKEYPTWSKSGWKEPMGREARFFAYKICFTARPSATDLQGTSAITPLGTNPLKHLVTRSMIQTSNLKPNTNRYRIFLKVGWVGWCRFIHLVKHFTAFPRYFRWRLRWCSTSCHWWASTRKNSKWKCMDSTGHNGWTSDLQWQSVLRPGLKLCLLVVDCLLLLPGFSCQVKIYFWFTILRFYIEMFVSSNCFSSLFLLTHRFPFIALYVQPFGFPGSWRLDEFESQNAEGCDLVTLPLSSLGSPIWQPDIYFDNSVSEWSLGPFGTGRSGAVEIRLKCCTSWGWGDCSVVESLIV